MSHSNAILITKFAPSKASEKEFSEWQARFRSLVAGAPGFISIEISSPSTNLKPEWVLNQRFDSESNLQNWKSSKSYKDLLESLKNNQFLDKKNCIQEEVNTVQTGVTQIYATKVQEDKIGEFQEWLKEIHEVESKFPGFQKVYVQAPNETKEGSWITLLQFDTEQNLENWINSPERTALMKNSSNFMKSHDTHRLLSSFGGWFTDTLKRTPPVWKQSMVVLLMLYPLIMLEFMYLYPNLTQINVSFSRFIGCALTCLLLSWPLIPIAIYLLHWWLTSKDNLRIDILGLITVAALYILEIYLLYRP